MCKVNQQSGKVIWGGWEKILVWAVGMLVLTTLGTAGGLAVGNSRISEIKTQVSSLRSSNEKIEAQTNLLGVIVNRLESLEEWRRSVNFNDRWTSEDAKSDRLIFTNSISEVRSENAETRKAVHEMQNRIVRNETELKTIRVQFDLTNELVRDVRTLLSALQSRFDALRDRIFETVNQIKERVLVLERVAPNTRNREQ